MRCDRPSAGGERGEWADGRARDVAGRPVAASNTHWLAKDQLPFVAVLQRVRLPLRLPLCMIHLVLYIVFPLLSPPRRRPCLLACPPLLSLSPTSAPRFANALLASLIMISGMISRDAARSPAYMVAILSLEPMPQTTGPQATSSGTHPGQSQDL